MDGAGKDSRLVWTLALLSLLAIVSIAHMKPSLELEDAEQAYYSQWWRLGYDDQPPLYTWSQKALNHIFGLSKFSLSLLRGLLFASILLGLHQLGKWILQDLGRAERAVLASVLLPVFIDLAFRRLSHTLLLTLAVILTTLAVARLIERKSVQNYLFLGFCLGIGMLSKYNYLLFVAALGLTALFNPDVGKLLLNPRSLLSMALGLLLFAPHLSWILSNGNLQAIGQSVGEKIGQGTGIPVIGTLWDTLLALLALTGPLLLVTALLLLLKKATLSIHRKFSWLYQLLLVQLALLPLFFMLTGVERIETRWLLPLLFPHLLLWAASVDPGPVPLKKFGSILFLALLGFQLVRSPMERLLGITSDIQFDPTGLSEELKAHFPDGPWVLPHVTYGGQMRLLNQDRCLLTLDDFSIPAALIPARAGVVLMSGDNPHGIQKPLDSLMDYGPQGDDLYFFKSGEVWRYFPK